MIDGMKELNSAEKDRYAEAIRQKFTREHWLPYRQRCDPLADAVVAELFSAENRGVIVAGYPHLLAACEAKAKLGGVACQQFLQAMRTVPAWVDFDSFALGEALFQRNGIVTFLIGVSVLVASYGGYKDNKVLAMSGRLGAESAFQRAVETAQFTMACTAHRGLVPHGQGSNAILQVRLLHARVRQLCRRHHFNTTLYDEPINQESMCGAIMLFSHGVIRALDLLGIYVNSAEKESYHALWRYGGYLMGIDEELLPLYHCEEEALFDCIQYDYFPDQDTTQLFAGTIQGIASGARHLPWWLMVMGGGLMQSEKFLRQFVGYLVNERLRDYLGLRPTPVWQFLFTAVRRILKVSSRIQHAIPPLQTGMQKLQWRVMHETINALLVTPPLTFGSAGKLSN